MWLLSISFCLIYGYFFQGGGWNQNSHFDTVRALVERHVADITSFGKHTEDIGLHDGKIYSNKGPGFAFFVTPAYFFLYHIDRLLGPTHSPFWTTTIHAHILTFLASGVPAVVLVLVLYRHFRRAKGEVSESLFLAAAFGAGTLIFPYSGILMSHVYTACTLFVAWHVVSERGARPIALWGAGISTGLAVMTDLLAAPAALILFLYVCLRGSKPQRLGYSAGAALVALNLAAYNYFVFGDVLVTNQVLKSPQFQTQGLVLGMLGVPEFIRLYWLTFHPYRGLFHCCPILLVPLLSLPRTLRAWMPTLEVSVPLAIAAVFWTFCLCFNGWPGGAAVGPRYLIPALPFMFSFALPGLRRAPAAAAVLMVVSTIMMFCVTAVNVTPRGANYGAAVNWDPVSDSIDRLLRGEVSLSQYAIAADVPLSAPGYLAWASYNLGEFFGLSGLGSVFPVALVFVVFAGAAVALGRFRDVG
jgi:hypothetical protein